MPTTIVPAGYEENMSPHHAPHLAQIDNVVHPITIDAIHALFSTYGSVQKIALIEKAPTPTTRHVLVQYADHQAAAVALSTLQGHCMYGAGEHKVGAGVFLRLCKREWR